MKVEYRLRVVTRYIITRYQQDDDGRDGVSSQIGEWDNAQTAYEVGYHCCKAEHQRLGYPLGDERIVYPDPTLKFTSHPDFQLDETRTTGSSPIQ